MIEKITALLKALEDILSKITVEPVERFFEKLNLGRFFRRELSSRFLATAFVVIIALISLVSVITVISERGSDSPGLSRELETTLDLSTTAPFNAATEDFKGNFLLLLKCKHSEDIHMLALARIDTFKNTVNLTFLNKNSTVSFGDFSGTFIDHLNKGGAKQLMWAVGEYANISIERYVVGDEAQLEKFAKRMGDITVNVKEKIVHTYDGINYIIEKGPQTLTQPMFLRYFLYLCSKDLGTDIANLMVLMGKEVFNGEDEEFFQKSMDSFTEILETNITAVDFGTYKNAIKKMTSKENPPKISVVYDLAVFRQ